MVVRRSKRYGGDASRLERHSIPEPNTGCYIFTGYVNEDGYGRFRLNDSIELAHRASYMIHIGPIPEGMQVCHSCDMPSCVNPGHFFLGSQIDNIADMVSKKRQRGVKGVKHPSAKLNPSKAFEIRWYDAIGTRHKDIAAMYGVTRPLISAICRNEIWQQECHD